MQYALDATRLTLLILIHDHKFVRIPIHVAILACEDLTACAFALLHDKPVGRAHSALQTERVAATNLLEVSTPSMKH